MTPIKDTFISWYFGPFSENSLFRAMASTSENSPHHQELNIGVHTNMVVAHFIATSQPVWDKDDVCRALCCAFHDVGKPGAREVKHSETRGEYYSFSGHEIHSARLWENYAVKNWDNLQQLFNLNSFDIYKVGWLIEHHRPWDIKRDDKRRSLALTVRTLTWTDVYCEMLLADVTGRISADYPNNVDKANEWISEFIKYVPTVNPNIIKEKAPKLYVLIGASGSGKSTWVSNNQKDASVFSLDALRIELYGDGNYHNAFKRSTEDPKFKPTANTRFMDLIKAGGDVIVDNTNTSRKSRNTYICNARQKGYEIIAILFPVTIHTLQRRQLIRTDKRVPDSVVRSQYMRIQYPHYGDFDDIIVEDTNLPS